MSFNIDKNSFLYFLVFTHYGDYTTSYFSKSVFNISFEFLAARMNLDINFPGVFPTERSVWVTLENHSQNIKKILEYIGNTIQMLKKVCKYINDFISKIAHRKIWTHYLVVNWPTWHNARILQCVKESATNSACHVVQSWWKTPLLDWMFSFETITWN